MLLTITTTHAPATDLGYLLHKRPDKVQSFPLSFGQAHVFYPEALPDRCTAALLLDVDPVSLVRGRLGAGGDGALEQYVNDRPYVASSFLSVAIAQVFGSALAGRSKDRPLLAESLLPLEARLAVLPCRGGEAFLRRLFEPLGYELECRHHTLDETFPEWGDSPYFSVALKRVCRLRDLLTHLYVLIPVLDDDKHYWVSEDEVEKLLRHGEGWLAEHPEREVITRRYLKHRAELTRSALARLLQEEDDPDAEAEAKAGEEALLEERMSLNEQRLGAVLAVLRDSGARSVVDLGCGDGKLLREVVKDMRFERVLGVDVSSRALEIARRRIRWEQLSSKQQERVQLIQGALTYRDSRLAGFDAAAVVEVIEHLDLPRLAAFERALFEFARPKMVVLTTPNVEYNVKFEKLNQCTPLAPRADEAPGIAITEQTPWTGAPRAQSTKLRHRDHRFEWTRAEFRDWAQRTAARFGYEVRFLPVGPEDAILGPPTQMGVFVACA